MVTIEKVGGLPYQVYKDSAIIGCGMVAQKYNGAVNYYIRIFFSGAEEWIDIIDPTAVCDGVITRKIETMIEWISQSKSVLLKERGA
jgi:hypothetical protein